MKNLYLKTVYSKERRPETDYPIKLANHLISKYGLIKGKILDLGCGRGEMLNAFSHGGFEVYGADLDSDARELCRPHRVEVCDFENEKITYDDNYFDYIFSKSVIEHLNNPLLVSKEIYRMLKPGGKIILMTPSWQHTRWGPFYLDFTHKTPFTIPSLKDLLLLSGFKEINASFFFQLPLLWKYPFLKFMFAFISLLPIKYSPMHEKLFISEKLNKVIRFSKEAMIIGVGEK